MPETEIDSAIASTNAQEDYSVASETTEAPDGTKEYRYQNPNFSKWLGYYKAIPELKIAVDTKANWVIGNGYKADEMITILLDNIKGNGKDSFNSILENMERTCYIAEDAYAEIITNDNDEIINLKPLDPGSIVKIFNKQGRLKRYEQVNKHKEIVKKFKPEKIFELSNNRMADEIHGTSIIPAVENVILARNEAMADYKIVMHRYVSPLIIWHLDTDDETEITTFKGKTDKAVAANENMYIPKGTVVPEIVSVAPNATLNPLTWIENLNNYFFQAVGVPQVIVGNAKAFTDASAKIVYLAFEQRIKGRQLYVEEQVLGQLNLEIKLTLPASLQQETISDTPAPEEAVQEEPIEPATQPNDTTVEEEGQT